MGTRGGETRDTERQSLTWTNILVDFDVRRQQGKDFFTGENIIMDYRPVFWPEAMVLTL